MVEAFVLIAEHANAHVAFKGVTKEERKVRASETLFWLPDYAHILLVVIQFLDALFYPAHSVAQQEDVRLHFSQSDSLQKALHATTQRRMRNSAVERFDTFLVKPIREAIVQLPDACRR